MPQASEELRNLIAKWFGDDLDEHKVIDFLKSHGFMLLRSWYWVKPCVSHTVSDIEYLCIRFLIDEWDFGGITDSYDYIIGETIPYAKA